jgi:hypothetical protein
MKLFRYLYTASCFALSNPVLADSSTLKLILPDVKESTLQVRAVALRGGHVEFDGQIWITGMLQAKWIAGIDETEINTLRLILVPDENMHEKMPHFEKWRSTVIYFNEESNVLKLAASKKIAQELLRKQRMDLELHGRFLIRNLSISIDCDTQSGYGELVEVRAEPELDGQKIASVHTCGR